MQDLAFGRLIGNLPSGGFPMGLGLVFSFEIAVTAGGLGSARSVVCGSARK